METALAPGALFHGRYRIVRRLARGGMGSVHEVVHVSTGRRRALKTMLPEAINDPELKRRFVHEVSVTAPIRSDHLVEVIDAGIDEASGIPFLVMELLEGEDLGKRLARCGHLPAAEVVTLLWQASLALDRTHAADIVHRDLKPENLFVTRRDDGTPRLRVLDFGIAKVVDHATLAKTTSGFGTPLYMSPEQIRGDGSIGPAADIYALGQIAFFLLTGHPYWEPEARETTALFPFFSRVVKGIPEPASARSRVHGLDLGPRFDAWFDQATALDPGARFQTASILVEELATALDAPLPKPLLPAAEPSSKEIRAPSGRSFGKWVILGCVAVLVAGAAVYFMMRPAAMVPAPAISATVPLSPAVTSISAGAAGSRSRTEPEAWSAAAPTATMVVPQTNPSAKPKPRRARTPATATAHRRTIPGYDPTDIR